MRADIEAKNRGEVLDFKDKGKEEVKGRGLCGYEGGINEEQWEVVE